jgi:hypothetical protein
MIGAPPTNDGEIIDAAKTVEVAIRREGDILQLFDALTGASPPKGVVHGSALSRSRGHWHDRSLR